MFFDVMMALELTLCKCIYACVYVIMKSRNNFVGYLGPWANGMFVILLRVPYVLNYIRWS